MSVIINHLTDKEKRALGRLGLAVLLFLALGLVLYLNQKNGFVNATDDLTRARMELRKAEKSLGSAKAESGRWQEARQDLESFGASYFYSDKNGIEALRRDLERIFNQTGVYVSEMGYSYADMDKVRVKKIVVSFNFTGTYAALRRLLSVIERTPKFLTVEKMDFLNTGTDSGYLNLRMVLAGYYEI